MKKIILGIALCATLLIGLNTYAQQGKWAGIVKYKLTWTGKVPQGVPQEWQTKVYKNMEGGYDWSTLMLGGKYLANSENHTMMLLFDFSQVPVEGVTGKWYIKNKIKDEDLKSAKYEYTGKTKVLAGKTCQEVKATFKDSDTSSERSEIIYVTKELGPVVNLSSYPGLDAFPMEYPIQLSNDLSVTLSASELQEDKVKEEDLMLETGFEEITSDDFKDMMQALQKAYGGAAGGSDDDM
jgi:hypothetical protein